MDTSGRQGDLLGPSCWRRAIGAQSAGPTLADDAPAPAADAAAVGTLAAAVDDLAVAAIAAVAVVLLAVNCLVMFKCNECEIDSRKVAGLGEHTERTELTAPLLGGESSRPEQS